MNTCIAILFLLAPAMADDGDQATADADPRAERAALEAADLLAFDGLLPGEIRITVVDENGRPDQAMLEASSEGTVLSVAVGTSGNSVFSLPAGCWSMTAKAKDGRHAQARVCHRADQPSVAQLSLEPQEAVATAAVP